MRKVSLILVGSLAISIALSGCGSKTTSNTTSTPTIASNVVQNNESKSKQPVTKSITSNTSTNVQSNQITKQNIKQPTTKVISEVGNENDAVKIVKQHLGNIPNGNFLNYEYMSSINNKDYYVIHYYSDIVDNKETGQEHSSSIAWYCVEKDNGNLYALDIADNKLVQPGTTIWGQ